MRLVRRAWRRLGWKQWASWGGAGLLVLVVDPFVNFNLNFYWAHHRVLADAPYFIGAGWAFMWAVALVDASVPDARPAPMRRYALAIATACLLCLAVAAAIAPYIPWPPKAVNAGKVLRTKEMPLAQKRAVAVSFRLGMTAGLNGVVGAFIFVVLRNARRSSRALAQAQLEGSESARRLAQLRLRRAREAVDPDSLVRSLRSIEKAYQGNRGQGDREMDAFILALRGRIARTPTAVEAAQP